MANDVADKVPALRKLICLDVFIWSVRLQNTAGTTDHTRNLDLIAE
jgi:hypothetical protein